MISLLNCTRSERRPLATQHSLRGSSHQRKSFGLSSWRDCRRRRYKVRNTNSCTWCEMYCWRPEFRKCNHFHPHISGQAQEPWTSNLMNKMTLKVLRTVMALFQFLNIRNLASLYWSSSLPHNSPRTVHSLHHKHSRNCWRKNPRWQTAVQCC